MADENLAMHTHACYDVSESQISALSSILVFSFLLTDRPTLRRRCLTGCFRHPVRFPSILLLVAECAAPFATHQEVNWIGLERPLATIDHSTDHIPSCIFSYANGQGRVIYSDV